MSLALAHTRSYPLSLALTNFQSLWLTLFDFQPPMPDLGSSHPLSLVLALSHPLSPALLHSHALSPYPCSLSRAFTRSLPLLSTLVRYHLFSLALARTQVLSSTLTCSNLLLPTLTHLLSRAISAYARPRALSLTPARDLYCCGVSGRDGLASNLEGQKWCHVSLNYGVKEDIWIHDATMKP